MAKYKNVRFPEEAYKNLLLKQQRIESSVKYLTKKKVVAIPLTKVLIAITENPITLPDKYILKLTKKKK